MVCTKEKWYKRRIWTSCKSSCSANKKTIKQFEHETESYPTADDTTSPENEFVPELNLLHKLGFSASYNEVKYFTSKNFSKENLAKIKLCNG